MQVVVITTGKTQGAALKLKEENNQLQEANHIHAVHINQNNGSSSAPQWPHNWKKNTGAKSTETLGKKMNPNVNVDHQQSLVWDQKSSIPSNLI